MTKYDIRLCDSLEKVLPGTAPRSLKETRISVWPGEVFSFQIAAKALREEQGNGERLLLNCTGADIRIRKQELEPVLLATYGGADDNYLTKTAAMIPDALMPFADGEQPYLCCLGDQWTAVCCDIQIPADACAGEIALTIDVATPEDASAAHFVLTLCVQKDALLPQTLLHTEWFHCDCLANYYNVPAWSEEHWRIVENFMAATAKIGINMLLTPVFTPALDTEIGHERTTTQLVDVTVTNGEYSFGFEKLDRWINLCRKHGITELEICHLFTQWGAAAAPKVMATVDGEYKRIFGWDTPSVGGAYTPFLRCFIPALKEHLAAQNMLEHTWFHVSDEPNNNCLEQWNAARLSVVDLLEDCKMMDALSSFTFYEQGLIKTPVVSENHIEPFVEAKVPGLWTYYCCGQFFDVPNRFLAMPSARGRMLGALLYRYDLAGFLQWGFNFYNGRNSLCQLDPWRNADGLGSWPAGDPFIVYPGKNGEALESLRAVTLREAMQDLRLLRLAEAKLGREAVLAILENSWDGGMITMTHYPTDPEWFARLHETLSSAMA